MQPDAAQSALFVIAIILMVIGLLVSLIPIVPGSVLLWAIAVVTAFADHFQRVPVVSVIAITGLMILGSTTEYWMPLLGIRARGGSCWTSLGAMIGSILGSVFIPIPILGTLIGYVLGALLADLARFREVRRAFQTGQSALKTYILSYVVQILMSVAIFAVSIASLWLTGR